MGYPMMRPKFWCKWVLADTKNWQSLLQRRRRGAGPRRGPAIRWFHHKTQIMIGYLPGYKVTLPGFVFICHVGKVLVSPKRNLAFEAAMPTDRWEERKHSPHSFHQSLERLKMVQMPAIRLVGSLIAHMTQLRMVSPLG